MTDLKPGMVISVTTTVTTAPVAGDHSLTGLPDIITSPVRWEPYDSGNRVIYGFTGGDRLGHREKPWSNLCLCNECAVNPVHVRPVIAVAVRDTGGQGTFMPVTGSQRASGYRCQGCQRKAE